MDHPLKCVGIDLGTHKSCLCLKRGDRFEMGPISNIAGHNWIYSTVYYRPGKKCVVSYQPTKIDKDAVVLTDTMRFFGKVWSDNGVKEDRTRAPYAIRNDHGRIAFPVPDERKQITLTDASEIATTLLFKMHDATRDMTGESIDYAVVAHPATWSITQKEQLKVCAVQAGFKYISLIEEPTATAYAFLGFDSPDGYYMVYDWGGGTFDLSLVQLEKGVITVKATDGNPRLGGFDIDDLVFNYIHEQCVKLFEEDVWPKNNRNQSAIAWECKVQKELLSIEQEVTVSVTDDDIIYLSRKEFETLISTRVEETVALCQRILSENGLGVSDVEKVILTGGMSGIPLVQKRMMDVFGEERVVVDSDLSSTGVAKGAYQYGEHFRPFNRAEEGEDGRMLALMSSNVSGTMMKGDEAPLTPDKPTLVDSFPDNIYIGVCENNRQVKRRVLERGKPYSTVFSSLIQLATKETQMVVNVYTGKSEHATTFVGSFVFEPSPCTLVTLRLHCDQGRYIVVSASWKSNGEEHPVECRFDLPSSLTVLCDNTFLKSVE